MPRKNLFFFFTISPGEVLLGRITTILKRPGVGKTLHNLEETDCFKVLYYSFLFPQPQALFLCLTTKEVYFI